MNGMGSSIPGYIAPAAGFEAPLEMLSARHVRIEHQCATLRRLVPYLAAHGAVIEARTAAANMMRYFDTSAKHHHIDEEEDLFPALIESMAGSDPVCLRELTAALTAEHRELEHRWLRVRPMLERVVAGDNVSLDPQTVEALVGLYERHVEREEQELLPIAARLLSGDDLDRIGRAMRDRRGIGEM
jgi:hemerythrin-like domain-containing protein